MRVVITLLLLTALKMSAYGQVSWVAQDSILIQTPTNGGDIWTIQVQNLNSTGESATYQSSTGTGVFYAPWCNIRVSRTQWTNQIAESEWSVDLIKVNAVTVTVSTNGTSQMGQYWCKIKVDGPPGTTFDMQFRHVAYGNWYSFMIGNIQYYPKAINLQPGEYNVFIPYRLKGQQGAVFTIHSGCSWQLSRLLHLN